MGVAAAEKGAYRLTRADLAERLARRCWRLWMPRRTPDPEEGRWLRAVFGERAWLAVELHRGRR